MSESKKSKIETVKDNGTYEFNGQTYYDWVVSLSNGDSGQMSTKDADHKNLQEGADIEYTVSTNSYGTRLKKVYNNVGGYEKATNFNNNKMSKEEWAAKDLKREQTIIKQTCLKVAGDISIANNTDGINPSNVIEDAKYFYEEINKNWNNNGDLPF